MTLLIQLLGAVALLLFGLRQVRNGAMRAYGMYLKKLARHAEGRVLPSFLAGLLAAVLLQSSTAAALITATFASQGIVSTTTALLTILGADIGTAVAAIVASQKVPFLPPSLIFIGILGGKFAKSPRQAGLFKAINGIGLILLSLGLVATVAEQIAALEDFNTVLGIFIKQPILMILLGAGFSYVAHSSLAVILISTGLVAAGVLDLETGIFTVLGANLGSGALPVIANWTANANARIPVTANLILRFSVVVIASLLAVPALPYFKGYFAPEFIPLAIHLVVNIVVAIVGIFGRTTWIRFATLVVPADIASEEEILPMHLDEQAQSEPSRALACCKREALRMADLAQSMVRNVLPVLRDGEDHLQLQTTKLEEGLDTLFGAIKIYLAQSVQEKLTETESQHAQDLLSFIASMEHIGDIVDGDLMDLARRKNDRGIGFSDEGIGEIEELHELVCLNFDLAVNAFLTMEPELAKQLYDAKSSVREIEVKSIATHIDRIGSGKVESLGSSDIHLDVLHALKRINSHLTTTVYLVLRTAGEMPRTKWKKAK